MVAHICNLTLRWLRWEVQKLDGWPSSEISPKQTVMFTCLDLNSGCGHSAPFRGPGKNWLITFVCSLDLLFFQRTGVPQVPVPPTPGGSDALFPVSTCSVLTCTQTDIIKNYFKYYRCVLVCAFVCHGTHVETDGQLHFPLTLGFQVCVIRCTLFPVP